MSGNVKIVVPEHCFPIAKKLIIEDIGYEDSYNSEGFRYFDTHDVSRAPDQLHHTLLAHGIIFDIIYEDFSEHDDGRIIGRFSFSDNKFYASEFLKTQWGKISLADIDSCASDDEVLQLIANRKLAMPSLKDSNTLMSTLSFDDILHALDNLPSEKPEEPVAVEQHQAIIEYAISFKEISTTSLLKTTNTLAKEYILKKFS